MASSKPSYTVPLHGNYHAYYQKRGSDFEGDERLALLPPGIFHGKRVLDIGCNEGYVTCEIAQRHGARQVVGVDIDAELVSLAWKRRRYLWSLQKPAHLDITAATGKRKRREETHGKPASNNSASSTRSADDFHYFPAALQHMLGPLPLPRPNFNVVSTSFPHNVSFVASDWAANGCHLDSQGYSVVVALSVTKWIHLNDGDDGIRRVFNRVYDVLQPGGVFVLEVQPSDSYHKARRMHPRLKAVKLELKPEQFGEELVKLGFQEQDISIEDANEGGFKRPLRIYTKPQLLDCSSRTCREV
ncbi:Bin3-domain-containing protein [Auriculariales sp. MPI-PUGE-AT-0066]|nr:Bin3-domain-containing protein [Auriculariales sp. MPI-PUGE-AT-0066]